MFKRRFPRLPSANSILVTRSGDRQIDALTRTHTVGLGGCGFVCDVDLGGADTTIELMICVRPVAFRTLARVAYQRERDDGAYDVGIEFINLPAEHRRTIERLFGTAAPAEIDEPRLPETGL